MVGLEALRGDQKDLIAAHPEWDVHVEDDPSLSCAHAHIRVDGLSYYGKDYIESAAFDRALEALAQKRGYR